LEYTATVFSLSIGTVSPEEI